MNYLAHIYLSGNNEMVTIGNFIADSIKGKQYLDYPKEVQIGILLHREIDTFTDAHPIVRQSSKRLHAKYSHYSGVIVDILYDHFLAKNWSDYSTVPLKQFTTNFYQIMEENFDWLPANTQRMLPFMKAEDWLLNYAQIEGIQNVLNGMNRRTNYKSGMHQAINELRLYYFDFEIEFTHFFAELINFTKTKLPEIENKIS
ncbi:ACP phosphodiesterase [Mangrovimonas sp. ST2L15]|uniref:acyl carrier protein phosphodiesterase n=1 Tax=Mangrovimonas sp. ST2L15 TaxID=1645916 RepID=UPI0006B59BC2|nr:ACP phosphodiesterase [Mangrovimonas sp. ST2L15]